MMDHVAILGLNHLDMAGIRQICVLDDKGELADDILIEATVGGGVRASGGGMGASSGSVEASGGSDDVVGS